MEYEAVKGDLRRAYDARAETREQMDDADWKHRERSGFADRIRAAGASRLLEIGAGHGVSGRYFADRGLEVTCVDLSAELVGRCRAKGLDARVMDFGDLEFDDGAFDAVFGMNCLLHVPRADLSGVLDEIERVLAPGGLFYWGKYGGKDSEGVYPDDTYEPKRFFALMTAETIERIAAERFEVLEMSVREPDYTGLDFHGLVLRRR
ncbi:class I SAM-dependent methyltransferase [Glycomyces xiaoerkulensis]|uniref:class I SAM-dependent methyltransferase n=1 Tax=Glycomyces xiaoerkulensis TaxID=2038139 RepID=UPI000C26924A|nr:class I SAM-dependent methyltransferase [Glycomyces xiaoerkulensis]